MLPGENSGSSEPISDMAVILPPPPLLCSPSGVACLPPPQPPHEASGPQDKSGISRTCSPDLKSQGQAWDQREETRVISERQRPQGLTGLGSWWGGSS